ncbi:MAG: sulfatase-like hydrolase/transferase [Acidimicrobiales bacterium]
MHITRREFVVGSLAFAAFPSIACTGPPIPGTNIAVLYLDDMREDGLNYMPKTMARFDHRFTQSRANGGACIDTRLGLFTGTNLKNHPWKWYLTATELDPTKTWGYWLQAAGYRTGLFGEYITTIHWDQGIQPGWDVWKTYTANGHDEFTFEVEEGLTPPEPFAPGGRNLDYMTDALIDFATTSTGPWFASWNPQHPHTITETGELQPRPEHTGLWTDLPSPAPVDEDVTGKPAWIQALPPLSEAQIADFERAQMQQAQVLTGVDDAIESFFVALEQSGQLENTLVILSSDQGVHYGEHRFGNAFGVPAAVQKVTLYEPVVRTPLLVTGPGFPAGSTSVPVTQADITTTVVGVAGAQPSHDLDGIDLRLVREFSGIMANRSVLLQSLPLAVFTPWPGHDSVVTGPDHPTVPSMKLGILHTGERELYDLAADPGEFVNLATDPAWDDAQARLSKLLNIHLA